MKMPPTDTTSSPSVITNGVVSGFLPESLTFAINYPGYPTSISRAIDTLGGPQEIEKVRGSETAKLELRFRPEDPYCHPAFGKRRACTGLVLKISKTISESGSVPSAKIVARVNEAYDFDGMVDYQHVPAVHAAESRRKKRPCPFDNEKDLEEEEADIMLLVPPLFSLKNIPEEIVLNPPPALLAKNIQKSVVVHRWEMDVEDCHRINYNVENVPKRFNWEDYITRDTTEWAWQLAVSKLFDERPIWPRRSIFEHLIDNGIAITDHMLRRFLFRTGYYFATGPFARFWIRKGYDPRKDPESRIYQKIDFRVPVQLRNGIYANTDSRLKHKWKDLCHFQVFPWKNFTNLQFFELEDDFIQNEIQKPTDETTCMPNRGWFSEILLKALRLRVSIRFLSICPNEDAQIVLRSLREEFERFKTLEALRRMRKPLKKHQEFNQDTDMSTPDISAGSNDAEHQALCLEEFNSFDIENDHKDEEEDEEEEEEEEELDIYEYQDKAVDGGVFSLDASSFQIGDNVPNDYLQDLLSGFPFSKDVQDLKSDKDVQDAELSDDEFQIYEQDSDDSYEDEDNYC